MKSCRLLPLALALVLVASIGTSSAQELPTLAGRWSASTMRSVWKVGDWGPACGPQPKGGSDAGGIVTITQQGNELSFSGLGRAYSTRECWEQFPGLKRSSHSAWPRGWRNSCRTSPGDSRQATIETKLNATDETITLDETGQYQFLIKDQNCTASVRRSRTYKLIQREGVTLPPPAPLPADQLSKQAGGAAASRSARCLEVGPPARLEVRPSRKLMRPGEEFSFRGVVMDAKGCELDAPVAWRALDAGAPIQIVKPGRVRILDSAPEGVVRVSATAAAKSVTVQIEIASSERYEALLRQRGLNEAGESDDAAIAVIATGAIGARASVAQDRSDERRLRFILIVGGAALLLGLLGLFLVRRGRKASPPSRAQPSIEAALPAAAQSPSRPAGMVCPTCRSEYPPGSQFCAVDGNRLVQIQPGIEVRPAAGGVCPVCGQGFDPGITSCPRHNEELVPIAVYQATLGHAAGSGQKICPLCGAQYPGDGRFCGVDGAALVPVN